MLQVAVFLGLQGKEGMIAERVVVSQSVSQTKTETKTDRHIGNLFA